MKTAEFVSLMHPDKICDRISASILDECLKQDINSRVAVETLGGHKKIIVMGEITTNANIDLKSIISKEINNKSFEIITNINHQSNEIKQGVDLGGAGDQGIMIGYACKDTKNFMPLEYELSRDLCKWIYNVYPYDGKVQITVDEQKVKTILVSWSKVSKNDLEKRINDWFVQKSQSNEKIKITEDYNLLINPIGDWNLNGFDADTGLTGRKIVIDSYGPRVSVGGGAFSGKDPTKVDLSGALMARKLAVDLLKSIDSFYSVTIRVAYGIGIEKPIMLEADVEFIKYPTENQKTNFNILRGQMRHAEDPKAIIEMFYPNNIIKILDLKKPQYKELSKWGHFGNNNLWDK